MINLIKKLDLYAVTDIILSPLRPTSDTKSEMALPLISEFHFLKDDEGHRYVSKCKN
jgi:hypothetical protein